MAAPRFRSLHLVVAWMLVSWALPSHANADFEVYQSRSRNGMPFYSTQPVGSEAKLVYQHAGVRAMATEPVAWTRTAQPTVPQHARSAASTWSRDALMRVAMQVAKQQHVELALVLAVMEAESAFNATALSSAGAIGPMQLMPATARRYGVDPWNPSENIVGGVRYLRDLLSMFDGDLRLALAAYNAGEGSVMRAGNRIPPFAETQAYVPKVLRRLTVWRRSLLTAGHG